MNGWTTGRKARAWTNVVGALVVLATVGCGGSETPAPLPPPPPPINNGYGGFGGGYGGGFGGGTCGAMPIGQTTPGIIQVAGNLSSMYGGANSFQVTLQQTGGAFGAGSVQSMIAQGCLTLGDLPFHWQRMFGPLFNPQGYPTGVPVSSQGISGGAPTMARIYPDYTMQLAMTGQVPVPVISNAPMGFGGAQQTYPGTMTVQMWGRINQNVFEGNVSVSIDGQPMGQFQSF